MLAIAMIAGLFIGNALQRSNQPANRSVKMAAGNKLSTIMSLVEAAYVDSINSAEIDRKSVV